PVGASLLAMTAAHPTSPVQADRYREQARSHSFLVVFTNFVPVTHPPVGASLLAMTAAHPTSLAQTDQEAQGSSAGPFSSI
ncbi:MULTISPECIES: hypothetical protein, partial [unclassified Pseudomonas]|uniref:hypothetical protein n=1 Tax=unclassified Pseudomonas TaxID=196821 RepID=UPI001C550E44